MDKVKNFAEKSNLNVFLSGANSALPESKNSGLSKFYKKIALYASSLALVSSLASCCLSKEEVEAMKSQVPSNVKDSIALSFDINLIKKSDSLINNGKSEVESVKKALAITWEEARASLKEKDLINKGEYFLTRDHYEASQEKCLRDTSYTTFGYHYGYSAFRGKWCYHNGNYTKKETLYNKGSLDSIRASVKERQQKNNIVNVSRNNIR